MAGPDDRETLRDPATPEQVQESDRLLDRVLRADVAPAGQEGITWEDVRAYAASATEDDGIVWDDAALAALALRLESSRPVPADIAERHLAAAHAALEPAASTTAARSGRGWSWRRRFASATAAVTAFTTFGGGAAVAIAQEAAPGDALYAVKRASEDVRLLIERSAQGDAELHLQFAERRVAESHQAPDEADVLLEDAFEHLAQAEQHGDEETRAQAQAAGQRAVDVLTALVDEGGLPETASPKARAALERARDRKQAHIDARNDGARGPDQAPGKPDDAPGRPDDAPGKSDAPGKPDDAPGKPDDAGAAPDDVPPTGS